ncbi:hypothetical protein F442_09892 [Phytophthora nicotianae P10297]|uniref:Uncharacterized protein n=1 Tax=Phytophthora nicotianae P10297 TaxID=1317064 RepID=W2ZAX4_PHYNI|nr:hypothetical protein F442_09892 [Phytophthora nicotianae P10297]
MKTCGCLPFREQLCHIIKAKRSLSSKLIVDDNADILQTRRLRSQSLLEWPEELEKFVKHHHYIREVFARWWLEDHEPKEAKEDIREERNPVAVYKKYMTSRRSHSRKWTVAEYNTK